MSIPAAVVAHCFAKCRTRQNYTRVPGISKPVFSCDGCGSTREIEELGRDEIPGRISPAPRAPALPVVRRKYTNRRTQRNETTVKKSPLIQTIENIIASRIGAHLTREEVVKIVEEQIAEQLGLEAAAKPKKRSGSAATTDGGTTCPRGDHKYACPSKKCIEAGYKA